MEAGSLESIYNLAMSYFGRSCYVETRYYSELYLRRMEEMKLNPDKNKKWIDLSNKSIPEEYKEAFSIYQKDCFSVIVNIYYYWGLFMEGGIY